MSSPIPSFHRFAELPLELRLQIWHLAADQAGSTGPQLLPLLLVHEPYWDPPRSYIHIPRRWRTLYLQPRLRARLALLHSCREARAELLQPPSSSSSSSSPSSCSTSSLSSSSGTASPSASIPSRPNYQLARAPQLGICTLQSPVTVWRAFLDDPATMMARPGSVPYYDDSSTLPLEHLYPPLDTRRGFAVDWRRDVLLLDLEAGASVWRWHPHGLPAALRRAGQVVVVHDHWRGVGVASSSSVFSTPINWMHRVVMHFGTRLRGLWFMSRPVWREAEPALLRVPWRGSNYGGVNGGGAAADNDDDEEPTQEQGVDPWDVLIREDREVSRDLVANGQVSLSDLPPQLGLTTEAINDWSTPVRVGTITGARSREE